MGIKADTEQDATYAIDAIADAISTVSSQRSSLGAVQNRLEHTINNLDNVVRILQQLSLVSVIQIWLKRWLTIARTTFLHRLISLTRVYFHSYSNHLQFNVVQSKKSSFCCVKLLCQVEMRTVTCINSTKKKACNDVKT